MRDPRRAGEQILDMSMQLASRLLLEGRQVAEVADGIGYESEAAFRRGGTSHLGAPFRP